MSRAFSYLRRLAMAALLALSLLPAAAYAVDPNERLADPILEARARALGKELRCMVCQNESIDDSNADLAHDLRVLVRERLKHGDSDAQIVDYLRARYGDFILLKPPIEPATYFLWFGPGIALLLAGGGIGLAARRRGGVSPPRPLDAEEQQRVAALLSRGEENS
jgi:cytochrome c-type biogenesis protein CcmH